MGFIIGILVTAGAFFIGAQLLRGVEVTDFMRAIIVALTVGVLDFFVGNLLTFVTLGLLGWGVFKLVLYAVLIKIADYFLKGFKVENFWWALALAVIVSGINTIFYQIF